ncbi:unnamed protein product [Peniophora sp. CBMAI 1063]|nr:unnamed protein product [Peniophora sp. CBMAI 1063]
MNGNFNTEMRRISGCRPGQLDSTQPQRVLRHPLSVLSFGSFDPHTAAPQTDPAPANAAERLKQSGARRVVLETFPDGSSSWRFVPNPHFQGVHEEGTHWPRVVDLCGEFVLTSLEQWDIYKLDPAYRCTLYPAYPKIIREEPPPAHPATASASSQESIANASKRPRHSSPAEQGPTPKRSRRTPEVIQLLSDSEGDESESEVTEMIIDSSSPGRRLVPKAKASKIPSRRTNRDHPRKAEFKTQPQPAAAPFSRTSSMSQSVPSTPSMSSQTLPTFGSPNKRKGTSPTQDSSQDSYKPAKRARTRSPGAERAEKTAQHQERMKAREREEKRARRLRAEKSERAWMESIHEDAHEHFAARASSAVPATEDDDVRSQATEEDTETTANAGASTASAEDKPTDPEEAARLEALRASRRKLEELERDRPLWEAAARERKRREEEEETSLRAKAEQRKREAEEAERARAQQATRERLAREHAQRAEREAKEAARRDQEWRSRMQRERWARGPWTAERALERYRQLADAFDARKFGAGQEFSFEDVPWPTLRQPLSFGPEDIDWSEVETFFGAARSRMRWADYASFVEKSHRRFHPDRWRSRGVLTSVVDETARNAMEVAANTVAQALTPLWREAKGR